ncbi:hypothetical protein LP414_27715 [Polaromonas sp. P1(28)-13]|nr:hypothetical protein LP414_27715 [Polaromonas sp. P1(28)-13]
MSDKFWFWLADRLPRKLVYFASIRLMAHATTGRWGADVVPCVTGVDMLKRWDHDWAPKLEPESIEHCGVVKPGWFCSREKGHEGPCAAWPVSHETAAQ